MATGKHNLATSARMVNSGAIHLLRGMRNVDREAGLTPARLSALSVLVFGGPKTLGRLAEIEDVAGPTMTRIVDGLARLDLAERTPHPDSMRLVLITATPDGEQLMNAAADRRIRAIIAGLMKLPAAERDLLCRAAPALVELAEAVREP